MADATLSPTAGMRSLIEQVNGIADPEERIRALRHVDRQLEDLRGLVSRYSSGAGLQESAGAIARERALLAAREDARLYQELVSRGLATADVLDAQGLVSPAEVGLVEAQWDPDAPLELVEGFVGRLGAAAGAAWKEALHPRDRGGKFRSKPGSEKPKGRGGAKRPDAPKSPGSGPAASGEGKKADPDADFAARRDALDKRAHEQAARAVKVKAAKKGKHPRSPGFGHTSQYELLAWVNRAATQPRTVDLYSEMRDGRRVYDRSRKQLHDQIIDTMLRRPKNIGTEDKPEWVPDPEGEYLPSQEIREVLFSGGGYAAGKGSTIKILAKEGRLPQDALKLDPDVIKGMLPEFKETLGSDPEANLRVYEEAWDISQALQRRAQERKLNVIVDGISDTSAEEMLGRVKSFKDAGYGKAHAVYVTIPTDEAVARAWHRARNATDDADKRFIPEVIMRSVHRDVSRTMPGVLEGAAAAGLTLEVYDNHQGKDENGKFRPPKRMLVVGEDGKPQVEDDPLWAAFLAKADETIEGVD